MKKYLVVHHRQDPSQPWANDWLDDSQLVAITTTTPIATLCQAAQRSGEVVGVHRCGFGDTPPEICCNLRVKSVAGLDSKTWLVTFMDQNSISEAPPNRPAPGQNAYTA